MKAWKIFAAMACIALLNACATGPGDIRYYAITSYVVNFYRAKTIQLRPIYDNQRNSGVAVDMERFLFQCNIVRDTEQYLSLCAKYNDTSYVQQVWTNSEAGIINPSGPQSNADSYVSIRVTSAMAWDDHHPAGSTLDDIVRMDAWSYYPYIRSGYTLSDPRAHIEGVLDAMDASQWIMLGTGDPKCSDYPIIKICDFYFTHPPQKSGIYPLTVTLVTDEGEVFEASCEVEFE